MATCSSCRYGKTTYSRARAFRRAPRAKPRSAVPFWERRDAVSSLCLRQAEEASIHAQPIQLRHVVVADPVALLLGQPLRLLVEHSLAVGPGRIRVREVARPQQPAHIDEVLRLERHPVVLERRVDVLGEIFARQLLEWR